MIRPIVWSVVLVTSVAACSNRQTKTTAMAPVVSHPAPVVQQVNHADTSPEVVELARSLNQTASSTALPDMSERQDGIDIFKHESPFKTTVYVDGVPTPPPGTGDGPTRAMTPDASLKRTKELREQTTPRQNIAVDTYMKW